DSQYTYLVPYTTLFRSTIDNLQEELEVFRGIAIRKKQVPEIPIFTQKVSFPKTKKEKQLLFDNSNNRLLLRDGQISMMDTVNERSEEHTSELQSRENLV